MKTKVVNIRREQKQHYMLIDRHTIFGNPFRIGTHGNRAEVIARYKVHFHTRMATDASFHDAVQDLKGKRLGCWCAPLACHGDVIVEYLEGGN